MRLSRSSFLAFFMFGALFFAILSPSRALADWSDVGSTKYICVTNVANSSFYASSLKVSPIGQQMSGINALVPVSYTRAYGQLSGVSGNTAIYLVIPVTGGSLQQGKRFLINAEKLNLGFSRYESQSSLLTPVYLSVTNVRYWGRRTTGAFVLLNPDSDGLFTAPYNLDYVIMSFTSPNASSLNGLYALSPFGENVIIQTPDGEPTIEGYIQEQTQELTNTNGSGDIVSGMSGQGQQIANNLNFVQQTGQLISGTVDAMTNAEPSEGLMFPGLTIRGYEIIPAQNVAFTGYLGSETEEKIRAFTTMVLFLMWVMGLRSIYRKIFMDEKEVEVVNEE